MFRGPFFPVTVYIGSLGLEHKLWNSGKWNSVKWNETRKIGAIFACFYVARVWHRQLGFLVRFHHMITVRCHAVADDATVYTDTVYRICPSGHSTCFGNERAKSLLECPRTRCTVLKELGWPNPIHDYNQFSAIIRFEKNEDQEQCRVARTMLRRVKAKAVRDGMWGRVSLPFW